MHVLYLAKSGRRLLTDLQPVELCHDVSPLSLISLDSEYAEVGGWLEELLESEESCWK